MSDNPTTAASSSSSSDEQPIKKQVLLLQVETGEVFQTEEALSPLPLISCPVDIPLSQPEKLLLSSLESPQTEITSPGTLVSDSDTTPVLSSCLICNEQGKESADCPLSPLTQTNVDTLCDILQLTPIPIDGFSKSSAKYHVCSSCNERIDGFKQLMVQLEALMGQIEVVRYSVAQQLLQSSAQDSIAGHSTPRHLLSSQLMSARAGNGTNATASSEANSEGDVEEDEDVICLGDKSEDVTTPVSEEIGVEASEDKEDSWEMETNPGHFLAFKSFSVEQPQTSGSETPITPTEDEHPPPPLKKKKNSCCSVCNKYCRTKYELTSHERTHFPAKQFRCPHPECNTVFTLEVNLEKHLIQAHRNKFPCPQCGNSFAKRSILLVHLRTHDDSGRYFTCPKCPTAFTHKYNLNKHLKSHTGVGEDQPHACPQCGACFARIPNLSAHIKIHGDGFGWGNVNDRTDLPSDTQTVTESDDKPDESKDSSTTGHELGVIFDDGESESDMEPDSD